MGRNSFQRAHDEAVKLLSDVMDIHAAAATGGHQELRRAAG